jgi:endonuclease/exonuclease/phosphatase (EEP) superfamily protein YafD
MALSALSVVAFFGSVSWIFDLLANFRVQGTVVLVVLGLAALAAPWKVPAIVTLVAAALGGAVILPYLFGSSPPVADGSKTLDVISFNVGISNPNRSEIAEWIRAEDPDVVFVFESSFEWEDTFRAADLAVQPISVVPPGNLAGVTILAKPQLLPRPVEVGIGTEAAAVSVLLGANRIEMLGLHPPSPTTASRAATRDRIMASAAAWVSAREGEVVVVGDFNATPWSHAFRILRGGAGLTDSLRGHGLEPSWPSGWGPLMVPIDHVLYTDGLASRDRRTGPAFESAHRPVLVTIGTRGL